MFLIVVSADFEMTARDFVPGAVLVITILTTSWLPLAYIARGESPGHTATTLLQWAIGLLGLRG